MKQKISVDQFIELNETSREKLLEWVSGRGYDHLLNIGQMIEFLGDSWYYNDHICLAIEDYSMPNNKKLCDSLWKAVKEVLESELSKLDNQL